MNPFSESIVKSLRLRYGGRIWRWQHKLLRDLARPFKKLLRRLYKATRRPVLYVPESR